MANEAFITHIREYGDEEVDDLDTGEMSAEEYNCYDDQERTGDLHKWVKIAEQRFSYGDTDRCNSILMVLWGFWGSALVEDAAYELFAEPQLCCHLPPCPTEDCGK